MQTRIAGGSVTALTAVQGSERSNRIGDLSDVSLSVMSSYPLAGFMCSIQVLNNRPVDCIGMRER